MINLNTLGNGLKRGLKRFSQKICKDISKPREKFVTEMVFGIISSKSCMVTEIGRALKEDISLKKTEDRLIRNLKNFSDNDTVMKNYLEAVRPVIDENSMLLVDGGDATKPCSPKMEGIGSVKDGSTGKFADGYWTMGVTALTSENHQPIPVYEKLYPCKKQGGQGFNIETKAALENIRQDFGSNMPRALDRGFDSGDIIRDLHDHNEKFIIRQNQNRVAVHKGKKTYINDIVRGVDCIHEMTFHSKTGNISRCKIGITQVIVPNMKNIKLNLVVCKNFGEKPLVLYTNLDEPIEELAARVVKAYLMRWRIEEYYAFKKQGLGFEGFRVRSLRSIRTLDLLATIAVGYIAILCSKAKESEQVIVLIIVSKRIPRLNDFLKKTKFFFYAVLDGITYALASLRYGISHHSTPPLPSFDQVCLWGVEKMG